MRPVSTPQLQEQYLLQQLSPLLPHEQAPAAGTAPAASAAALTFKSHAASLGASQCCLFQQAAQDSVVAHFARLRDVWSPQCLNWQSNAAAGMLPFFTFSWGGVEEIRMTKMQ